MRKLMNPAFGLKVLHNSLPIFNDETNVLVQNLAQAVGKPEFDIFPFMNICSLRNVCGK